jgi:hypothetical protein
MLATAKPQSTMATAPSWRPASTVACGRKGRHAMDAERFDRIAKTFAARASRRWLLRGLAALGLGSGLLDPGRAGARRAPGGSAGSEATIAATDPTCAGQAAITNKACPASSCSTVGSCFCAESVSGSKKCVSLIQCPTVDQCDSNRHCDSGQVCIKFGGCCGGSRKNACVRHCV